MHSDPTDWKLDACLLFMLGSKKQKEENKTNTNVRDEIVLWLETDSVGQDEQHRRGTACTDANKGSHAITLG